MDSTLVKEAVRRTTFHNGVPSSPPSRARNSLLAHVTRFDMSDSISARTMIAVGEPSTASPIPTSNSASTTPTVDSGSGGPSKVAGSDRLTSTLGNNGVVPAKPPASTRSIPPAPVPTDTGKSFNSTVAVTLNWTTPMLSLEHCLIDAATGYCELVTPNGSTINWIDFVGVGYGLNGTMKMPYNDSMNVANFSVQYLSTIPTLTDEDAIAQFLSGNDTADLDKVTGIGLAHIPIDNNSANLGEMSHLYLSHYMVVWGFNAAQQSTLHNVTYHIPVKTQA